MLKRIVILMILLSVLLAACAPDNPNSAPTEVAVTDTPVPEPTAVSQANCIVQAAEPTLSPTLQAILPPVDENDHTMGAEDAYVTVIEYGDFQ